MKALRNAFAALARFLSTGPDVGVRCLVRAAVDAGQPSLLVVSPGCPVGCGFEVVLLKSVADGSVFCFCDLCGCGFWRPEDTLVAGGPDYIIDGSKMAPEGAEMATFADVVAAGFEAGVIGTLTLERWGQDCLDDLNERAAKTGTSDQDG